MQSPEEQMQQILELGDGLEATLVELVVAASDFSEDPGEISDLIDGLLETGRVQLVRGGSEQAASLERLRAA